MATESDYNKQPVITPIAIDDDTIYVPAVEEVPEEDSTIVVKRRVRGRVRWYDRSLRYGFLHEDGRNDEVFVHQTSLQMPGVKTLRPGQRVIFEICQTSRNKLIATNVIPIMERPEILARYRLKNLTN